MLGEAHSSQQTQRRQRQIVDIITVRRGLPVPSRSRLPTARKGEEKAFGSRGEAASHEKWHSTTAHSYTKHVFPGKEEISNKTLLE